MKVKIPQEIKLTKMMQNGDFPGDPVVRPDQPIKQL